jgi:hypothetical protein
MNLVRRIPLAAVMMAATLTLSTAGARAQEISEAHLAAARAAVAAIKATEEFDTILPMAAGQLKQQLIQQSPHLEQKITETVDAKTLELASRRADLEREAATAYARVFTQQELTDIAAFYNSEAGKKLLSEGPIVIRELLRAAEIWQRGVARDLMEAVGKDLADAPAAPAAPEAAPAGEAPAQDAN